MATVTWSTASDWDNAVSESLIAHENVSNTDHSDASQLVKGDKYSSLPEKLNYYYPCHENSGTTLHDIATIKSFGTANNTTIISPGSSGSWDDEGVRPTHLVTDPSSGNLWLYYEGKESSSKPFNAAIGITESSDGGSSWSKKSTDNPVISPSKTYDTNGVRDATVIPPSEASDSSWHIYYTGRNSNSNFTINHATSSDGLSWTKDSNNPILSGGNNSFSTEVKESGGSWYLFTLDSNNNISRYSSGTMDAQNWAAGPTVLSTGSGWDSNIVREPFINQLSNGEWEMWYVANNGSGNPLKIGRATASDVTDSSWSKDSNNPHIAPNNDNNYPVVARAKDFSALSSNQIFYQNHSSAPESTEQADLTVSEGGTNNGSENGNPTYGNTGILGSTAIEGDGSGDYFSLTNANTFTNGYTIAFWAYQTGSDGMPVGNAGNNTDFIRMRPGNPEINFQNSSGNKTTWTPNWNQNEWNHWALVDEDDGTMTLYKNGSGVANKSSPSGGTNISIKSIFEGHSSGFYFPGKLAEVQIWEETRTSSEIQNIYDIYNATSTLETATKSFSSSVKPDLQNLSYSLNGESITLDVIGSPGTGSEEVVSQSLDGTSSFDLTWTNSHTDFRVKPKLSTTTETTSPTFNQAELQATVVTAGSVLSTTNGVLDTSSGSIDTET